MFLLCSPVNWYSSLVSSNFVLYSKLRLGFWRSEHINANSLCCATSNPERDNPAFVSQPSTSIYRKCDSFSFRAAVLPRADSFTATPVFPPHEPGGTGSVER